MNLLNPWMFTGTTRFIIAQDKNGPSVEPITLWRNMRTGKREWRWFDWSVFPNVRYLSDATRIIPVGGDANWPVFKLKSEAKKALAEMVEAKKREQAAESECGDQVLARVKADIREIDRELRRLQASFPPSSDEFGGS